MVKYVDDECENSAYMLDAERSFWGGKSLVTSISPFYKNKQRLDVSVKTSLKYIREVIQVKGISYPCPVSSPQCGSRWRNLLETPGSSSAAVQSSALPGRSSQPAAGRAESSTPPAWPADLQLHPTGHQTPFSTGKIAFNSPLNSKSWGLCWKLKGKSLNFLNTGHVSFI